jgi:L-lactate dehydrogenase complex protein LldG
MTTRDPVQTMAEKAATAGTVVELIGSMEEAVHYAVALCLQKKMSTLTAVGLGDQERQLIASRCEQERIELLNPPLRDHAQSVDIALTFADAGIADTGTLVVRSDSENIRIATMLSKIHVAVLPAAEIKQDADEMAPDLDAVLKTDAASYTAFITGPSRTADIERVLAIGVHGPLELHLLILKEGSDHD